MEHAAELDNVDGKYLGADLEVERAEAVEFEGVFVIASLPLRRSEKERMGSGIVLAFRDATGPSKNLQPSSTAIGQV